jgi:hypothetical protein
VILLDADLPQVKHDAMRKKRLCRSAKCDATRFFSGQRGVGVTLKNNREKLRRANHLLP